MYKSHAKLQHFSMTFWCIKGQTLVEKEKVWRKKWKNTELSH